MKGQGSLVGLLFDHVGIQHQGQWRPLCEHRGILRKGGAESGHDLPVGEPILGPCLATHVVAVRQPEPAIESVPGG